MCVIPVAKCDNVPTEHQAHVSERYLEDVVEGQEHLFANNLAKRPEKRDATGFETAPGKEGTTLGNAIIFFGEDIKVYKKRGWSVISRNNTEFSSSIQTQSQYRYVLDTTIQWICVLFLVQCGSNVLNLFCDVGKK